MDDYIKDVVFKGKENLYEELRLLSERIRKLDLGKRPVLIEFLGTCRSGKSTAIELIQDVLVKNGFKVLVVDEECVKVTKEINGDRNKKMSVDSLDYTHDVIEEKLSIYDETVRETVDVIIYDRGINDEFVWLDVFEADDDQIVKYGEKLQDRYVDLLVVMTCSVETTLKRKYLNSLSVMPSKWTNRETMERYLAAVESSEKYFDKHSRDVYKIETDDRGKVLVALDIAKKIVEIAK